MAQAGLRVYELRHTSRFRAQCRIIRPGVKMLDSHAPRGRARLIEVAAADEDCLYAFVIALERLRWSRAVV